MPLLAPLGRLFAAPGREGEGYYYTLDLARGFAACAVLVWHYQHFIALGYAPVGSREGYPFYALLTPLYEQGGSAVQLFWIISGFVFSAVYLGTTASTWHFFINRFARLYPLHLLTLVIVALLQVGNRAIFGQSLVYHGNSAGAFLVQLVMASGWTTPVAFTFNGPVWSVSAELVIYALFWLLLPLLFRWGVAGPLVAAVLCLAISRVVAVQTVALCGFYFFTGAAVFAINRAWRDHPALRTGAAVGVLVASVAVFFAIGQGVAALLFFAGLVMLLTAINRLSSHRAAERMGWLGDSTYGIYLWHIPVQLAFLLLLGRLGIDRHIALDRWFFLLYVVVVLMVARLSFTYIERPARGWLREKGLAWRGTVDVGRSAAEQL